MSISGFVSSHRALKGWRRLLAAFGWGAASILAFPPFNFFPALAVSLSAFFLLVQGTQKPRTAFAVGWSFGFGFFIPAFYWIAGALFVDIKTFWWILPLAVGGLPLLFALYYGIACALARRFLDLERIEGWLGFGLLLFLADYARGHLLTGFPWDLFGYVWGDWLPWLQTASLVGIYGLTFLTVLMALSPALLALPSLSRRFAVRGVALAFALFCGMGVLGAARLASTDVPMVPDVNLRLVQPAIDQSVKWKPEKREENFQNLLTLSFGDGAEGITHVIWPETATAYYLNEDIEHRLEIVDLLPKKTTLITGSVQRETTKDGLYRYYNSLVALDKSGYLIAGYDKTHLVPFGEYIPFRDYLPKAATSAVGMDFISGKGLSTIKLPRFPAFSSLVCYEAIFSGEVARRDQRPELLINLTNDAWYKGTIGPIQHFAIVRTRAVEEGIPLIRVSNMGISAVIDPVGRVVAATGMEAPEVVDTFLPSPLSHSTLFAMYGDMFLWIVFVFGSFFVIVRARRRALKVE